VLRAFDRPSLLDDGDMGPPAAVTQSLHWLERRPTGRY
jgi:hypothetical protein